MKITTDELDYCKNAYQVIMKYHTILNGYINYMGFDYQGFYQNKLKGTQFYFYRPDMILKQSYVTENEITLRKCQITFLLRFLEKFQIYLSQEEIVTFLEMKKTENSSLFYNILGIDFLRNFSYQTFLQIPLFQAIMNHQMFYLEQVLPKSFPLQNAHIVMKEIFDDLYFKNILEEIRRFVKVKELLQRMPDLKKPKILCSFSYNHKKESWSEKKYNQALLQKEKEGWGFYHLALDHQKVFIPVYASFITLFHEVGHLFYSDVFAKLAKIDVSVPLTSDGIFFYGRMPMSVEIMTEYVACKSLARSNLTQWNYVFKDVTRQQRFFPLFEPFWEIFGRLIAPMMMEQRTSILPILLGQSYVQYLFFLEQFQNSSSVPNEEDILYVHQLVGEMKDHFKNYQCNYESIVEQYIDSLKRQGKKVRVLRPSMERLKEEEQHIQLFQTHMLML